MSHALLGLLALLVLSPVSSLDDYLKEMKTTKSAVQNFVQSSIGYGSLNYPSACSVIPMQKRPALVQAVGEFGRAFVKTEVFKKWYEDFREGRRPAKPDLLPLSAESRKMQIAEFKKNIAEQEKAQADAPADQKAIYKDVLTALRSMLKELENQKKSADAEMDEYIRQANATASQEYKAKLETFEKEYPAGNPKPLLQRRLREFLESTATVDFTAKLVKKGDTWEFANPAYEKKDRNWKMAFRAGKETIETARTFAKDWLKEL